MHNSQARGEDLDKTEKKGVKTYSCIREAFGELDEQAGHGVGRQGREQDPVNPADGLSKGRGAGGGAGSAGSGAA